MIELASATTSTVSVTDSTSSLKLDVAASSPRATLTSDCFCSLKPESETVDRVGAADAHVQERRSVRRCP